MALKKIEKMPNGKILFYNKPSEEAVEGEGNYYFLTNYANGYPFFASLPTKIDSKGMLAPDTGYLTIDGTNLFKWETSEHLFQALKYTRDNVNLDLIKEIMNASGPNDARNLGQTRGRDDWHNVGGNYRLNAMRWVVREKFKNPELKEKLLETQGKELIENTKNQTKYNDEFWGNGNGKTFKGTPAKYNAGEGENQLGKILMELRTELQNKTGWSPPTPPPTPPSTPSPTTSVPDDGEYLGSKLSFFRIKIESELVNRGITTNDLSPQYQNWLSYISDKRWKAGEFDNYENGLKKEIERAANKKKRPNTLPPVNTPSKANQKYRDKWIQELEKEFQELEFGDQHDIILRKLSEIKDKIKDAKFDTEEKIENLGREFLNILKKFGKRKSNPTNNPSSPPIELTPKEKKTLSNQLESLSQKTPEDLGKDEKKPVEISTIKRYFQANNNVSSITLEDNGELTIEFQDKPTQTSLANNDQLQLIKKYLRQKNEKFLNREKLNISQNSNHLPSKPNYLPHILAVGGLVSLVLFSAFIVFRQKKIRKRKQKSQENQQ